MDENYLFILRNSPNCKSVIEFIEKNELENYFTVFEIYDKETRDIAIQKYMITATPTIMLKMYGNQYVKRSDDECIKLLKEFKKSLIKESVGKGPSTEDMRNPIHYNPPPPPQKSVSFKQTEEIIEEFEEEEPIEEFEEEPVVKKKPNKTSYKEMIPNKKQNMKSKFEFTDFNTNDLPELPDVYGRKKKDYF